MKKGKMRCKNCKQLIKYSINKAEREKDILLSEKNKGEVI